MTAISSPDVPGRDATETIRPATLDGHDTVAAASKIILVRHGLPGGPAGPDPGLGPEGVDQARRLGTWLRGLPVVQVVASSYMRAHETARHAAEPLGLDVRVDERLREWDSDRAVYATPEAIAATERFHERGFTNVKALFGGLDLWKFSLDPEIVGEETFLIPLAPS